MLFISLESEMEVYSVDKKPNESAPNVGLGTQHSSYVNSTPRASPLPKINSTLSVSVPQTPDNHLHLSDNDVLCGRGSVIHKHTGNRRFRRLISANKADYANCDKNSHKYFLALSIVLAIERQGGRFVKRSDERIEDSCLIILSRKDAVAKTAQALRDQLHRGGGGGDDRPRRRSKSTSPIVAAKKQSNADQDSVGMDYDGGGGGKINAESNSDDGSREESSSDCSSNDSSTSNHSNDMDCDTGFSPPMFAMMAPPTMLPITNTYPIYPQPFPLSSMVGHYPTSMQDTNSNSDQSRGLGFHSTAPARERLWIPAELEALVHEDPNVAWALSSLE
jgi:hypothetical protein